MSKLNVHQSCILWGYRVVIPECLRQSALNEIHAGHIGVAQMKSLARSNVWWPKLDKDIENLCKSCAGCKSVKKTRLPAAKVTHGVGQAIHGVVYTLILLVRSRELYF